ncbi:MAG: hypothetical protein IPP77_13275 [Bacteroidetes bacterium]|nr:hypothetical protein [Bacteroidota bacterium]
MRLLSMKAEWLIAQGKRHNAMELYEKLLRLHPDDAIGARLPLQVLYLEFKEYDKFIELQERFSDGFSVHHHYNYALYLYMVQAGEDELDEAMDEAIEFNPYVLPYLQGKKKIKDQYLTRYNPKDESGATVYCVDALYLWHQQYGIQKWLKKFS